MNRSNSYVQLSLLSVTVLLFGMFVLPDIQAQTTNEIIAITLDLQKILLDADEVIPLLNTNNIANMSKVTVSATLPCNSSNVPDLKITGGVLGNTTDIISTSGDYVSLRGPFDTCLFEGTIDISDAPIPALNRIFLINDGTSSVLTNLGTTVTLTGIFVNQTSEPTPSPPTSSADFEDDFTGTDDWSDIGTLFGVDTTNDRLDFDAQQQGNSGTAYDLVDTVCSSDCLLRAKVTWDALSSGSTSYDSIVTFGISANDENTARDQNQDSFGFQMAVASNYSPASRVSWSDDGKWNQNQSTMNWNESTGTYYIEIEKDNNTVTVSVYSDEFVTLIDSLSMGSVTGSDYRYIIIRDWNVVATPTSPNNGSFDYVKFWDGVTSPP